MHSIAQQLNKKNIAEYLIYMWQMEDLIRAQSLDIDKIKSTLINPYFQGVDNELYQKEVTWFTELIDMMRLEGVIEKGHLQINKNIIIKLNDLHTQLISSPKFPFYNAAFYKALPFIVELRSKNATKEYTEIETCFEALYGVMLLKLQRKEISEDTEKAMKVISELVSMLANYYEKERTGDLKFD